MVLTDFISVVVPFSEEERKIYSFISTFAGFPDPIIVDPHTFLNWDTPNATELIAKRVAEVIKDNKTLKDKKALIIGRKHYNIAFCYNTPDVSLVTFDAHNDSFKENVDEIGNEFSDGSFLLRRNGKTYIIGSDIPGRNGVIKVFPPNRLEDVYNAGIGKKIFLSFEIDVLKSSETNAHDYPHDRIIDKAYELLQLRYLSLDQVLETSKKLIFGREVVGINLAGYNPSLEKTNSDLDEFHITENHRTAEMLTNYLIELRQFGK